MGLKGSKARYMAGWELINYVWCLEIFGGRKSQNAWKLDIWGVGGGAKMFVD